MWLAGYWMEHGGFQTGEILALSPQKRTVWQAIAELNREQRKEEIRDAVADAIADILRGLTKE